VDVPVLLEQFLTYGTSSTALPSEREVSLAPMRALNGWDFKAC